MGMSTRVVGIISDDDPTYKKHFNVLRACIEADISELPKETADYFGSSTPYYELAVEKLEVKIPKHVIQEDMVDGYDIIVSEIPEGVKIIRFTNSY